MMKQIFRDEKKGGGGGGGGAKVCLVDSFWNEHTLKKKKLGFQLKGAGCSFSFF